MPGTRWVRLTLALVPVVLAACIGSGSATPSTTGPRTAGSDAGSERPCAKDAIPPGDYEHVISKAKVAGSLALGYWVATTTGVTDPNCYFPLNFTQFDHEGGKVLFSEEHPYTVEGDRIVLHGMGEVNAHYRIVFHGDAFTWVGGNDDVDPRRAILKDGPWTRIS